MRFDVVTLFPEMFAAVADCGITSRARHLGLWDLALWNPRDFVSDNHRTVDDRPFGGGPGMVMMAEPLAACVEAARSAGNQGPVVVFSPVGERFDNDRARHLSSLNQDLILICGRYEGIDERFIQAYDARLISLGDFVLSGGELAAMAVIDACVRLLPGALKEASAADESFSTGLLDAPHYTRPEVWRGQAVPEVLLSGHHKNIALWTRRKALQLTATKRPDLIRIARSRGLLTSEDEAELAALTN